MRSNTFQFESDRNGISKYSPVRYLILLFLVASQFRVDLYGQLVEIGTSPNPVGSGARAMSKGNAFIAVADDATAASWNPGGLTQLQEPEWSFAVEFISRSERMGAKQKSCILRLRKQES